MRNRIYAWSIGSATRKFQLPILLLFYSILIWRMDHHLDRFIPFEQLRVSKNLSKYLREKQKRVRENLLDLFSKCFQVYIMTNLEETYSTSPSCTPWWLSCCRSWRIDQEQSVGRSKARDVLRLYKTNESRGEWNMTNILRRLTSYTPYPLKWILTAPSLFFLPFILPLPKLAFHLFSN